MDVGEATIPGNRHKGRMKISLAESDAFILIRIKKVSIKVKPVYIGEYEANLHWVKQLDSYLFNEDYFLCQQLLTLLAILVKMQLLC